MDTLFTFETLRKANVARLPTFKNVHGVKAHPFKDGSDWSVAEWSNAMAGEVGELAEAYLLMAMVRASGNCANWTKKHIRGDITDGELKERVAHELADVVTYADILAFRCEIDLGAAIFDKFNGVSSRVDSPIFLDIVETYPGRASVYVRNIGAVTER